MLVLMGASSLFLIFAVLKQSGNTEGVSAIQGQSSASSDTFYGKNQGKKLDRVLKRWTMISGIALAASSIIFFLIQVLN
jgi:protein translocase SecG subunit